jgi:Arc/MetJ-type ribon-helix-helix transcriptional regulator
MTQIAVKLPDELVERVDRLVEAGTVASRSQAVRRGLEVLLRSEERRLVDAAFADGFARLPETEDEMAEATRLAIDSIEDEPWERW